MSWSVLYTEEFHRWFGSLDDEQQDALDGHIQLLEEHGPTLGRPIVDRIRNSRHHNMKELRTSKGGALRVLFAFDPLRRAILLVGGDKTGQWEKWYRRAIPQADELFDQWLQQLEQQQGE